MKRQMRARIELATFLQAALEEIAIDIKEKEENTEKNRAAKAGEDPEYEKLSARSLLKTIDRVKAGDELPVEELMKLTKVFKDNITLDQMSRAQLIGMCRFFGMSSFASDTVLRMQLRAKVRALRKDDQAILWEGPETLSLSELKAACAERGMRAHGLLKQDYLRQLQHWIHHRPLTHSLRTKTRTS